MFAYSFYIYWTPRTKTAQAACVCNSTTTLQNYDHHQAKDLKDQSAVNIQKIRSFHGYSLLFLTARFGGQNALKLTYEHLRFQIFFRGLYPRTPFQGEPRLTRREGERITQGEGEDGRGRK